VLKFLNFGCLNSLKGGELKNIISWKLVLIMKKFKFQPISQSWVAIHPQPKGVIQFIGGVLFGSFPTISYKYFLKQLFDAGYTIIALPFRFTFNHWSVAVTLLEEQYLIHPELINQAQKLGYDYEAYLDSQNFYWVGHSLGCKYIALLEFLSGDREQVQNAIQKNLSKNCKNQTIAKICNYYEIIDLDFKNSQQELEKYTQGETVIRENMIINQTSLLIAPEISNTRSAIPIALVADIIDKLGLGVNPTMEETYCLILDSQLFNLLGIICFKNDTISRQTCKWFVENLNPKLRELPGKHLEPIGIQVGNFVLDLNPFDKFLQPIKKRNLERQALEVLNQLHSMLKM
jgi:hypothetical protein